jgi:hypothetical protein
MRREIAAPLLRDVRITMLDYWRIRRLYLTTELAFNPGDSLALFVKITMDGNLSDAMFDADLHLYHPRRQYESGYSQLLQPTLPAFAEEVRQFFERHAEI